ncbi:MAG: 3-oxoacyl-ACP reductase FabG [Deltaproteobacteria bacterium]|nr:3-oxoacyl-ACP reductase FabG [Deltaproteobacteria bacterium]
MKVDLSGKVALVTGASRGIGKAIAVAMARSGASVGVNYRTSEMEAAETVKEIESLGVRAAAFKADVGDQNQVEIMLAGIESTFGRLDILVNNAGVTRDALLLQMGEGDWEEVLRINLWGVYHCSKAAAKGMVLRRWGRIINLSSIAATMGRKGQTNYSASKGAIDAFTRSLAAELGAKGVTVNSIAPGLIVTDMTRGILPFAESWVRERIAVRRPGTAADVAPLTVFLASEGADYITGQVIAVDGGLI